MVGERDFEIVVDRVTAEAVTLTITFRDKDRNGQFMAGRKDGGQHSVPYGIDTKPAEIIQTACRNASPDFFSKAETSSPTSRPSTGPVGRDGSSRFEATLNELQQGRGLGRGESAPTDVSVERFRAFMASNPRVMTPQLASTPRGEVRARWANGRARTLTITFAADGPLMAVYSWARHGDYGMAQARCYIAEERDVTSFASAISVPMEG